MKTLVFLTVLDGCGGSLRLGTEFVSTTKDTSQESNTLVVTAPLPKPEVIKSEVVDFPGIQIAAGSVGKTGVNFEVQGTQGVTWSPKILKEALAFKAWVGVGLDNYWTGLGNKETTSYRPAGYIFPSVAVDLSIPLSGEEGANSIVVTPFWGMKTYFNELKFETDDFTRARAQLAVGGNVALSTCLFKVGANLAFYATDRGLKEGITPLWGDGFIEFPFTPKCKR